MAPRDPSQEAAATGTPDPIEKGIATLTTLRIGVKAFVEKDGEKRKAEILSMQQRKGNPHFYVHYEEFNKRLDEWVPASRLDLTREVEWPAPEKPDRKKTAAAQSKLTSATSSTPTQKAHKGLKRPRPGASIPIPLSTASPSPSTPGDPSGSTPIATSLNVQGVLPKIITKGSASGKENALSSSIALVRSEVSNGPTPKPEDDEMLDLVDVADAATAAKATVVEGSFSREDEIEKLRTSGSMTQNQTEISRVRNLSKLQMGRFEMEPWYFSPYPVEFTEEDLVYICEFCLGYFGDDFRFQRHRSKCALLHPPGNEIYRDDHVSFFEIDGRRQRTWCRNLCLLSKLFLDHKTLYYDVDPFLFYCMTTRDEYGHHLVGYFSKEKESAEGYNVACILTLPQYQRKGFGRLLIAFSYELSKREGKLGSPEKPLSDLGLLGYRAYWQETVTDILMDGRGDVTVEEVGASSAMTTNDVLHTLQNLNMLRYSKGQHVIVLTNAIVEQKEKQREKEKIKGKRMIDPEKLQWKAPVFTASSRTWNW